MTVLAVGIHVADALGVAVGCQRDVAQSELTCRCALHEDAQAYLLAGHLGKRHLDGRELSARELLHVGAGDGQHVGELHVILSQLETYLVTLGQRPVARHESGSLTASYRGGESRPARTHIYIRCLNPRGTRLAGEYDVSDQIVVVVRVARPVVVIVFRPSGQSGLIAHLLVDVQAPGQFGSGDHSLVGYQRRVVAVAVGAPGAQIVSRACLQVIQGDAAIGRSAEDDFAAAADVIAYAVVACRHAEGSILLPLLCAAGIGKDALFVGDGQQHGVGSIGLDAHLECVLVDVGHGDALRSRRFSDDAGFGHCAVVERAVAAQVVERIDKHIVGGGRREVVGRLERAVLGDGHHGGSAYLVAYVVFLLLDGVGFQLAVGTDEHQLVVAIAFGEGAADGCRCRRELQVSRSCRRCLAHRRCLEGPCGAVGRIVVVVVCDHLHLVVAPVGVRSVVGSVIVLEEHPVAALAVAVDAGNDPVAFTHVHTLVGLPS